MIESIPLVNQTGPNMDLIMLLKDGVPFVAYIGAVIAVINGWITYKYYIKNKPLLNIDFSKHFELNEERKKFDVYVSCMNAGDSAVTISYFGFYISELDKYVDINANLFDHYFRIRSGCTRLEPGCNIAAWIDTKDINDALASAGVSSDSKLFFYFKDGHKRAYICQDPFYLPKPAKQGPYE